MPSNLSDPNELEQLYRERFGAHLEYRMRVWKTIVANFLGQYVAADSAVLDLGCGYGGFINTIQCRKKFAMDLNPESRRNVNPDVTFIEQDSAQPWAIPDASLDLVFSSNFFEHLPSKPILGEVLLQARRCLRENGRLIAMGPNIRFVGGAYWDFADHHLPLTESSMSEMLRMRGFRIERAIDRFLPYTMVNTRRIPSGFIALYLKLPPVWKIFGKQFLVIATKP
jgi:SAM-dependent methyltransferase